MNEHAKKQGVLIDRGRTKWTAMMLPEHLQLLREWQEEDNKTLEPNIDEMDLQLIVEEIERAYTTRQEVRIKTWKYGYEKQHQGAIVHINPRYLVYDDPFGEHVIYLRDITSVDILT